MAATSTKRKSHVLHHLVDLLNFQGLSTLFGFSQGTLHVCTDLTLNPVILRLTYSFMVMISFGKDNQNQNCTGKAHSLILLLLNLQLITGQIFQHHILSQFPLYRILQSTPPAPLGYSRALAKAW